MCLWKDHTFLKNIYLSFLLLFRKSSLSTVTIIYLLLCKWYAVNRLPYSKFFGLFEFIYCYRHFCMQLKKRATVRYSSGMEKIEFRPQIYNTQLQNSANKNLLNNDDAGYHVQLELSGDLQEREGSDSNPKFSIKTNYTVRYSGKKDLLLKHW